MQGLTEKQREKLHKAIDLAERPGACEYHSGGQPCCVIGQLAHLEGAPLSALVEAGNKTVEVAICKGRLKEVHPYPTNLLQKLQRLWDRCPIGQPLPQAEAVRPDLHAAVDAYAA